MNFKNIFTFMFVAVVFTFYVSTGECYSITQYKDVPLSYGTIKLPDDAYLYRVDLKYEIEKLKQDKRYKSEFEDLFNIYESMDIYQVVIDDGQNYRSAVLVGLNLQNIKYSQEKIEQAQKNGVALRDYKYKFYLAKKDVEKLILQEPIFSSYIDQIVVKTLASIDKKRFYSISTENKNMMKNPTGLLSYTFHGIKEIDVNGQYGLSYGADVTFIILGLILNTNLDGYAFNLSDDGVGVLFMMSFENDKEFWRNIFESSMSQGVKLNI